MGECEEKDEGHSVRRFVNLLREAHRTAKVTPIVYPVVFLWTASLMVPFYVLEPEVFNYNDHV